MDALLGVAGIIVSVGLFVLGYRQTVGARKERTTSANADLERLLVRRVVLESYVPTREGLGRLLEAQARAARVPVGTLYSEEQLLNTVYFRLLESDLIPPDRRQALIDRVVPALVVAEGRSVTEQVAFDVMEAGRRSVTRATLLLAAMGAAASALGGVVTVIPDFGTLDQSVNQLLTTALPTVVASLGIISLLIAVFRLRANQGENRDIALARYSQLEREVVKHLGRAGAHWRRAAPHEGFDFWVEQSNKHFLVEVKAWERAPPSKIVADVVMRVGEAVQKTDRALGIVVTSTSIEEPSELPLDDRVRLMTLKQFRDYLEKG